jgi:hypothetical protein
VLPYIVVQNTALEIRGTGFHSLLDEVDEGGEDGDRPHHRRPQQRVLPRCRGIRPPRRNLGQIRAHVAKVGVGAEGRESVGRHGSCGVSARDADDVTCREDPREGLDSPLSRGRGGVYV